MASVNPEHVGDEALERYVLGRTGAQTDVTSAVATLEEHLLVCEYCRRRATQFEDEVAALRAALLDSEKSQGK